jgi:ABC-type glycerol-3-phosphate transport system permease component
MTNESSSSRRQKNFSPKLMISAPNTIVPTGVPETSTLLTARRRRTSGRDIILMLIMIAVALAFLFPFAWMVLTSFKPTFETFKYSYPLSWKTFIPPDPSWFNYQQIFTEWHFERNILNSIISASGQVLGTCIVCPLAAFVFARIRFPGRELLFGLVMATAFLPLQVIVVPLYIVMRALSLVSTYPALFLPFTFSPFGIFLMRQAFLDIPRELDDAATVDGASLLQIFWHIILPNAKPALATLAVVQFLWNWNNFLWPLVIMADPQKQVVQVAISGLNQVMNYPLYGELFAASTVATIPVLILFLALQRYYVRGLLMSGMKG